MSGNYRGKIEMWLNTGSGLDNCQGVFKGFYDFWNSHPNATMLSINYGAYTALGGTFSVTNNSATVTASQTITIPTIVAGTTLYFSNQLNVAYTVLSITGVTITLTSVFTGATLTTATATVGSGTGYYDGYQPFGQNAWFVFRLNATLARPFDVYHMFQWTGGSSFGSQIIAPGLPGLLYGSSNPSNGQPAVFHSACIGIGGTGGSTISVDNGYGNPYQGSTNLNGVDTKTPTLPGTFSVQNNSATVTASTTPTFIATNVLVFSNYPNTTYTVQTIVGNTITLTAVFAGATNAAVTAANISSPTAVWGSPPGGGTGYLPYPRSNSIGGNYYPQSQNMGPVWYGPNSNTIATRVHIVADDDSFCIMTDPSDNSSYFCSYSGIYVPRPNLTVDTPYLTIDSGQTAIPFSVTDGTTFGDVLGTNAYQGGIATSNNTNGVRGLQIDRYPTFMGDTSFHPNRESFSTQQFDEYDISVGVNETGGFNGFLGQINFIREVLNIATNYTKTDFTRIYVGSTTVGSVKLSVPWDSENDTIPRSGVTRAGVTFVNNKA